MFLHGPPGAGKSALLAHARGEAAGLAVVTARGSDDERHLPHALVADLLRSLGAGDARPEHAATALAAAARERPLLCLVDDLDRADIPSQELVHALAEDVAGQPLALLAALSTPPRDRDGSTLVVDGLGEDDARSLLEHAHGHALDAATGARLAGLVGGNPGALIAIPPALTQAAREGRDELPEPLPAPPPLLRGYRPMLLALPAAARALLLAASLSGEADSAAIGRAAAALGATPEDAGALAAAGLAERAGAAIRRPPALVRAVVCALAGTTERRAVHRVLATIAETPDRTAWHAAAASVGPDAEVARDLAGAGRRLVAGGRPIAGAQALARAAELEPDAAARRTLQHAAVDAYLAAGRAREAGDLLGRSAGDRDAATTERLARVALARSGEPELAGALTRAAELIGADDPERAAWLLGHSVSASVLAVRGTDAIGAALSARRLRPEGSARVALGLLTGGDDGAAIEMLETTPLDLSDVAGIDDALARAACLAWFERDAESLALLAEIVPAAERLGARSHLVTPPLLRADLTLRAGDHAAARRDAGAALALADELGRPALSALAHAALAQIAAVEGEAAEVELEAAQARDLADQTGTALASYRAADAVGLLALGDGRYGDAVEAFAAGTARAAAAGVREPSLLRGSTELVDALAGAGRRAEARSRLSLIAELAGERRPVLATAIERCRGLVADDPDRATAHLERALAVHPPGAAPFERGRTLLAYGMHLRRLRRLTDARAPLEEALAIFEPSAAPWAARARAEIAAARGRPAAAVDGRARLTPQELRIAEAVAAGNTNRQVAASLRLSEKTVETHLAHVFTKLGVRSRGGLAAALSRSRR